VTNLPPLPIAPSRRSTIAVLLAVLGCALLWLAAPAGAIVTEVSGTSVGLQPRNGETVEEGALSEEEPARFANENGHAVLHGTNVYAIYWDPGDTYRHEWSTRIDRFLQDLGAESGSLTTIFSALGQYRDRSNQPAAYHTVFKGAYSDTAKYPTAGCTDPNPLAKGAVSCLTDAQLREQLQSFIAGHGLAKGMGTVYYLMTPPGVTVCVDAAASHCSDFTITEKEEEEGERNSASYKQSFCSYHGAINPDKAEAGDGSTILYAAIPWTAGYAGMSGFVPAKASDVPASDCQDGGFSPLEHKETLEVPKERTKSEEEAFAKMNKKEKAEEEKRIRLEGPHIEEPSQEGRSEFGDYAAGLADLLINQIAIEQANTVTDPLLNAWQDTTHHEVTDECRNVFAATIGTSGGAIGGSLAANLETEAGTLSNEELVSDKYYINNVFSLSGGVCVAGAAMVPRFTAPNPVNVNEVVGFDGMESTVGLLTGEAFAASGPPSTTYATYSWNFGDGTPEVKGYAPGAPLCETPWLSPCAGSIFHTYAYGGKYSVKLTITDVAGNVAGVTHEVLVNGPSAPAPASASSSSGANPGDQTHTIVNPVAAAAVLSRSLKQTLQKGLAVRYNVNEQVAGNFEVLISSALAKRLGLTGPLVSGLPAGTPPQVMIAHAVLVTTKAGGSTIRIKFSPHVADRLRHAHRVPLLVRMFVRNAAPKSPATTTVLSAVTLVG